MSDLCQLPLSLPHKRAQHAGDAVQTLHDGLGGRIQCIAGHDARSPRMRQRFPSMQTSSEDPHDVAGKTKLKGARSNWFYAASGKTSGGTCSHTHTQWAPSGWRRRGSSSERSRSRRCLPRLVAGLPAKWPSPRTANTFSLSLLWWGLPVASDLLLWLLQRKFPRSFFPRIAAKLHPPPPPAA